MPKSRCRRLTSLLAVKQELALAPRRVATTIDTSPNRPVSPLRPGTSHSIGRTRAPSRIATRSSYTAVKIRPSLAPSFISTNGSPESRKSIEVVATPLNPKFLKGHKSVSIYLITFSSSLISFCYPGESLPQFETSQQSSCPNLPTNDRLENGRYDLKLDLLARPVLLPHQYSSRKVEYSLRLSPMSILRPTIILASSTRRMSSSR